MIAIKHAGRTRRLLHCSLGLGYALNSSTAAQFSTLGTAAAPSAVVPSPYRLDCAGSLTSKELVETFRAWFQLGNDTLIAQIFEILRDDGGPDQSASDLALSKLNLRLTERFVLDVLRDGKKQRGGVLLCLKFFDWAGRHPHFYHTRATFYAMIKILSQSNQKLQMVDFLQNVERNAYKLQFYDTLVMGYAMAGKPDLALQQFGRMRFKGLDLNPPAYEVMLNALLDDNCFDAVKVIEKQVMIRQINNPFIHSVMIKSLCKQNQLDTAVAYLHGLLREGKVQHAQLAGGLITSLCEARKFDKARSLMEEVRKSTVARVEDMYSIWLRELTRAGKLNIALEFFKSKKELEGYIPDVFRYNMLIYAMLRKNLLVDAFDLLVEMKENGVVPDQMTIDVTLCYFCKLGMVDVACELYDSCSDLDFSPNLMFYNYLINALCDNNSTAEAYHIWKNSIAAGYFPGKMSFGLLTDALYRENKINEMRELVLTALERNFQLSTSTYDKFVMGLCKERRVEEGYLLHKKVSEIGNLGQHRGSFVHLIHALNRSNRADIAATLLIEMQEKGHKVTLSLYKSVITCLCKMDDPARRVLKLLEKQLACSGPKMCFFNFFICGAGHAGHPDLAREVYEIMKRNNMQPNATSDLLLLKSYLRSSRIFDAMSIYGEIGKKREIKRRLYTVMIVGLCEAGKVGQAVVFFKEMRSKGFIPSIECYEFLVRMLCGEKRFVDAIKIVVDMVEAGRCITAYIGNTLLWWSFHDRNVYSGWFSSGAVDNKSPDVWVLGRLLSSASSGYLRSVIAKHVGEVVEAIKQCYHPDTYTYNMLLRMLVEEDIDSAISFFIWMCEKGSQPNRWTYNIMVGGLHKHGRRDGAKRLYEEMRLRGFDMSEHTRLSL